MPARPYKPRDKAKVEAGVLVVQRWIMAVLRQTQYSSTSPTSTRRLPSSSESGSTLGHLRKVKEISSQKELFETIDRPNAEDVAGDGPYEYAEWKTKRGSILIITSNSTITTTRSRSPSARKTRGGAP